jgi:hypothetical protein
LAAALLVSSDAVAQSLTNPAKPAAARAAAAVPAKKPVKPAAPVRQVSAPSFDGEPGRVSDYWTIERALPSRTSERVTRAREADTTPGLNQRIPLQNAPGSIGIASGNIRATEFSDGRPVPGLTQNTRGDSSYVGLSLSAPSDNKSFPLFAPPAARWNGGGNGW